MSACDIHASRYKATAAGNLFQLNLRALGRTPLPVRRALLVGETGWRGGRDLGQEARDAQVNPGFAQLPTHDSSG
jgi:hypothetical protein